MQLIILIGQYFLLQQGKNDFFSVKKNSWLLCQTTCGVLNVPVIISINVLISANFTNHQPEKKNWSFYFLLINDSFSFAEVSESLSLWVFIAFERENISKVLNSIYTFALRF